MAPIRMVYLISLGILGVVLAAVIYSIPGESTKYKEVSRSELILVEQGWVLQMDLSNHEDISEKYAISVKVDDTNIDEQNILIQPESRFRFSYGVAAGQGETVSFKVYLESNEPPLWEQEFYQKI